MAMLADTASSTGSHAADGLWLSSPSSASCSGLSDGFSDGADTLALGSASCSLSELSDFSEASTAYSEASTSLSPYVPEKKTPRRVRESHCFDFLSSEEFTMDEVRRHSSPDDCWLIAHGVVYDATRFMSLHPGGPCIAMRAGQDATRDFDFHTKAGRRSWGKFRVGTLRQEGNWLNTLVRVCSACFAS
eukprot:TRINITY_DN19_c0_g1_i1.p1 TRINITY_DN19_c0_g1~~TRINITY_DN19_c0_g1_i1.p1  ORF type:complete len:189 (+),score=17.35 TRINITY_DN19_c0_g1_i1:52-618(+)